MKISVATARIIMGITQDKLKKVLGITQSAVSKIENGYLKSEDIRSKFYSLFEEWKSKEVLKHRRIADEIESFEIEE